MAKLAIDRVQRTKRTGGGDRHGLRLGDGRQHPRHVPDRLPADRRAGHQGGARRSWPRSWPWRRRSSARPGTRSGRASRWASASSRSCRSRCSGPRPTRWGIREVAGDPETDKDDAIAWLDESNYYYIKVENSIDAEGKKRTLVLDNLIHGYFILDHPERLDYDYEHIYALVADRVARAKAKAKLAKDPKAGRPRRP